MLKKIQRDILSYAFFIFRMCITAKLIVLFIIAVAFILGVLL